MKKKRPLYTIIFSLAFSITMATNCFAQLPDVLICGSPGIAAWNDDVQSKLIGTGQFNSVTLFDIISATPTVEQLQAYDAVLLYTDFPTLQNGTLLGDNLATYVDGGGGVVAAVFVTASIPIGGNFNTETYQVIIPAGQTSGTTQTLGTVWMPDHPIMQGVNNFNGGLSSYRSTSTTLAPGAFQIADWNDGTFLITAKIDVGPSAARRVDLGFFPPSSDAQSDFWVSASDGALIMANALTWVVSGDVCPVPVNLSENNITATSAFLQWESMNGAIGYQVAYKVVGGSPWTMVHSMSNQKKITGLLDNTKYVWKVKSVCSVSPLVTSGGSSKETFITSELRMTDESLQEVSFHIYPNPAGDQTSIQFTLPQASHISVRVYDMSGREMETVVNDELEQGDYSMKLNTNHFTSGVYFVRMVADDGVRENQKLIIQ